MQGRSLGFHFYPNTVCPKAIFWNQEAPILVHKSPGPPLTQRSECVLAWERQIPGIVSLRQDLPQSCFRKRGNLEGETASILRKQTWTLHNIVVFLLLPQQTTKLVPSPTVLEVGSLKSRCQEVRALSGGFRVEVRVLAFSGSSRTLAFYSLWLLQSTYSHIWFCHHISFSSLWSACLPPIRTPMKTLGPPS